MGLEQQSAEGCRASRSLHVVSRSLHGISQYSLAWASSHRGVLKVVRQFTWQLKFPWEKAAKWNPCCHLGSSPEVRQHHFCILSLQVSHQPLQNQGVRNYSPSFDGEWQVSRRAYRSGNHMRAIFGK